MKFRIIYAIVLIASFNQVIGQDNWTSGRPDGHAPISVMGDHTHSKGDWMFSYRFMTMNMDGMRGGTSDLSTADVLVDYMITPEQMIMNMHMLGLMYAVSDNLTLMAMTNYTSLDMDLITRMGVSFKTKSEGIGDLKLSGLYKFLDKKGTRMHGNLTLSVPTGSIENKDETPMSNGNEVILPYPMQIGTGTWDVSPGVTYLRQNGNISWGGQATATLRLGENDREYTWGNKGTALGWFAYKTTEWLSFSAKLSGTVTDKISGRDAALNPTLVPTMDPDNFGGQQVWTGLGLNIYIPDGAFKNVRVGIEYELPVYQDLNGTQMKPVGMTTIGIQYSL